MNDGYIALIDSGVGGISLLLELKKLLPNERFLYFGDNDNAPYGNKHVRTLKDITFKNIDYIKHYNIKVLVVACNTLSVNILKDIEAYSGIKTFGVFPPIEISTVKYGKTLLLSTMRTAEIYQGIKEVTSLGLKTLAKDIENNLFNLETLNIEKSISSCKISSNIEFNALVLGCTHYFFVKDKISDHLKIKNILYGENFTAKRVKEYLEDTKTLGNNKQFNVLFVGKNANLNQEFFNKCGQIVVKKS